MRTAAAIAVCLVAAPAILAVAVLALDSLLPARIELATVWPGTFRVGNADRVEYFVPLSGGELAACQVGARARDRLPPQQPIRVRRSRVLDRCAGVEAMGASSRR